MAKVYFKVLTKTEDIKRDVNIRVRFKEGNIDQSTSSGESVKLQYWDLSKQKFKRTAFKGKDEVINKLKKLEGHILEEALKTNPKGQGWLYNVVDKYLHPFKYVQQDSQTMFKWIESWIDKSDNGYRTIRAYHSTLKNLKEFNPNLEWNDLDLDFYADFLKYLASNGYSKNTIASRIKNLKVFCNAASQRKIHDNISFKSFKKQSEESFNIYLDEEELKAIHKLDLSKKPYLDRVRDIFLVGCWTGCRFSDLDKVTRSNIEGDYLKIEQKKTEKRVTIPLHPVVVSILEKYEGEMPQMISNQKFNDYIKDVCSLAKLKSKVTKSITKGGKRKSETYKKWEMVSSHTARRSFATNLYKSGFPSLSIMAITGHKTEKAFYSYIKVKEEEHAEMLMKHWRSKNDKK
ncbi:phage integrase SAM-like domain-containing protein [Sunxiuqinia sp. A32]|uniref:phage integrase SAM-like domain-containing protein n=1 Tax=Sunxiuqinia sp. A32 TaxID=3461496 RepID=UPI004045BFE3